MILTAVLHEIHVILSSFQHEIILYKIRVLFNSVQGTESKRKKPLNQSGFFILIETCNHKVEIGCKCDPKKIRDLKHCGKLAGTIKYENHAQDKQP